MNIIENRSKLRYALFRCQSGSQEKEHLEILSLYNPLMKELSLSIDDFSITWDIGKKDVNSIIQGFEVISSRNALFTANEKALGVSSL